MLFDASEFKLVQTCGACPEAYDVMYANTDIGTMRLRHGHFTVRLNLLEDPIMTASPAQSDGIFDSEERSYYLSKGLREIADYANSNKDFAYYLLSKSH